MGLRSGLSSATPVTAEAAAADTEETGRGGGGGLIGRRAPVLRNAGPHGQLPGVRLYLPEEWTGLTLCLRPINARAPPRGPSRM